MEIKRFLLGTQDESKFPDTPIGKGATPWGQEFIADLPAEALRAREMLEGFDSRRFAQGQEDALGRALSGESSFDVGPEATTALFAEGVAAPAWQAFESKVIPTMREGFAAGGGLFNTRAHEAILGARTEFAGGLTSQLAQQQFTNQRLAAQMAESAADRSLQAVSEADRVTGQELDFARNLAGFGGIFQAQEQARINAAFNEFQRIAPENDPFLQRALQFTGQGHVTPFRRGPSEGQQIASMALEGTGALLGSGFLG